MCYSVLANDKKVCQAIQGRFGYQSKPWQATVIMDIVYDKKDVMVTVETGVSKGLIYQTVFLINPGAIILKIISTITLIKDQDRKLK